MTITISPLDTAQLLGFYSEVPAPANYFRALLVSQQVNSEDEYIDFEKLVEGRQLAPLVIPTAEGRPMYQNAAKMTRFKPAYLKPKDSVSPGRVIKRRPGERMFAPNGLTPARRHLQIVGDILRAHRDGIDRYLEFLCAQAAIFGKVTLEAPDYPKVIIDFGRKAEHTVALTGAAQWSNQDADILGNINAWRQMVRRAEFGGPTNRLTIGSAVVEPFLKNNGLYKQLDTQIRGTDAALNIGLREGDYSEYLGRIGSLEIWTTSDFYQKRDGSTELYMPSNGALLTGPNIQMTECYGAILDEEAGFQALSVFPKQWSQKDPGATFVMTQSSPLMVPVNPNNSVFATVL